MSQIIDTSAYGNYTGYPSNLTCGWKYVCKDPCCPETTWPDKTGCSCCDGCTLGETEDENPGGGEYTEEPCCFNGTCCACKNIAGDAPNLVPQAVGCGRRHICQEIKTLPLCREQLDESSTPGTTPSGSNVYNPETYYADLPGRPPHTIVCVRATGARLVNLIEGCGIYDVHAGAYTGTPTREDLILINDCNSYNLWLRFKIPVEVIVRDCAGYLYCMKSFFTELVRIPLTARVHNLGEDKYVYVKIRVRLCYPNQAEATPLWDPRVSTLGPGPGWLGQHPMNGCTAMPNPADCGLTSQNNPTNPQPGRNAPFNCIVSIANNAFRHEDQLTLAECLLREEEANGCHYAYTFGTYQCANRDATPQEQSQMLLDRCHNGNPKLDILLEACVVKFVAEGVDGGPYVCIPT